MSFQDRRRQGSFQDIPFNVKSVGRAFGRNVATYEYATGEEATALDRGKKITSFSITAFLIGDDYDLNRNSLISILESGENGTLVVPQYGSFLVQIGVCSVKESAPDLSYVEFTFIAFVTEGDILPAIQTSQIDRLSNSGDELYSNAISSLIDDVTGAYKFTESAFNSGLNNFLGILETLENVGTFPLNLLNGFLAKISVLTQSIQNFFSPVETYDSIRDSLDGLYLGADPEQIEEALELLPRPDSIFLCVLRLVYLDVLGRAASFTEFNFRSDALNLLEKLVSILEEELLNCASFDDTGRIYTSIQEFSNFLVLSIPGERRFLLREVSPEGADNAISILYENRFSVQDIETLFERNLVSDPLLLSGDIKYIL